MTALISHCAYKLPMPVESARDIIVGKFGSHFDFEPVDELLDGLNELEVCRRDIPGERQ